MDLQNVLRIVGKVAGIIHWVTRLLRGKPTPPPDIDNLKTRKKTENE